MKPQRKHVERWPDESAAGLRANRLRRLNGLRWSLDFRVRCFVDHARSDDLTLTSASSGNLPSWMMLTRRWTFSVRTHLRDSDLIADDKPKLKIIRTSRISFPFASLFEERTDSRRGNKSGFSNALENALLDGPFLSAAALAVALAVEYVIARQKLDLIFEILRGRLQGGRLSQHSPDLAASLKP